MGRVCLLGRSPASALFKFRGIFGTGMYHGESYLTLLASGTNRRVPLLSAVDETGRPNKTLGHSGFGNILETSGRFFSGFPIFVGQFFLVFSSQVFLKLFKFEQF
jgi:hypothetical protein